MSWLNDWGNRYELTIDSNWVDEDLTNFPVLITLASGTGKNDFDATGIFNHLTTDSGIDSYTSFMLPTDGDRSSSQHPIAFGFEPYITTVSGISCVSLNGTNQIVAADEASADWDLGLDDFTLEAYINADHFTGPLRILSHGNLTLNGEWSLGVGDIAQWGSVPSIGFSYRGGADLNISSDDLTSYLSPGTWHHIAMVRSSLTAYFFLDGVLRGTASLNYDLTAAGTGENDWLFMAARRLGGGRGEFFPGYMTRWALHKGEAKWTSNYTPTEYPVKTAYTKFLYNCEGDGSQYQHNLYMISDPEVHTSNPAASDLGYWYFDADPGPDDSIHIQDHSSLNFGSGDFTIEFWFHTIQHSTTRGLISKRATTGVYGWVAVHHLNTGALATAMSNNGSSWGVNENIAGCPAGEWVHYAVTRENDTVRIYLNGVLHRSVLFTGTLYDDSSNMVVGAGDANAVLGHYGYIQGMKISKGIARYTGNFFSPPNPPEGDSWENRKKIQITDVNNNKLYTEIEQWDHTNEKAKLWTKVPTVLADTDTTLYLYYDNTQIDNTVYVGDVGEPAAESVWTGNNFTAVYHMAILNELTTTNFLDSTSNNNVGDFNNMDVFDFTEGQVSRALDFTRAGSEYINLGNESAFNLTSDYTIEVVFRPTSGDLVNEVVQKAGNDSNGWQLRGDSGNGPVFQTGTGSVVGRTGWTAYGWQYAAAVLSGTTLPILYMDGYFHGSGSSTGTPSNSSPMYIGRRWDGHYFNGDFDEVRLSNVPRSSAWVKANYYSMWDDLLSYAAGTVPVFTCSGIVYVDQIPASGINVALHRRSTNELIGTTTTAGTGTFEIDSPYDDDHYIVAFYTDDTTNALIYDWINPTASG